MPQAQLLQLDDRLERSTSVTAWGRGPERPAWLAATRSCVPLPLLRPKWSVVQAALARPAGSGALGLGLADGDVNSPTAPLVVDANVGIDTTALARRDARSLSILRRVLLDVERAIGDGETAYTRAGAVQDAWSDIRPMWVAAVQAARCASQLTLLLDLLNEECLLWDMISDEGNTVDRHSYVVVAVVCEGCWR